MLNKGINLFSGLSDEEARKLGLDTELCRFASALKVTPDEIKVHDMLAITSGRIEMPRFEQHELAIIGGSPECILESTEAAIRNERELVRRLTESAETVVAICYGFQLLVRALGGVIGKANPPERGFSEVRFTKEHPVLNNIPRVSLVSTFHADAVHGLPDQLKSITDDDGSGIQMAVGEVNDTQVYGTQFHPEILTMNPDLLITCVPEDETAVVRTTATNHTIMGPELLRNLMS